METESLQSRLDFYEELYILNIETIKRYEETVDALIAHINREKAAKA